MEIRRISQARSRISWNFHILLQFVLWKFHEIRERAGEIPGNSSNLEITYFHQHPVAEAPEATKQATIITLYPYGNPSTY